MGHAIASLTIGRDMSWADSDYCAIVPLDLSFTLGRRTADADTHGCLSGHRGPVPWSLQPESRAYRCTTGDRARQSGAYMPLD
jgi:hypothetical protein